MHTSSHIGRWTALTACVFLLLGVVSGAASASTDAVAPLYDAASAPFVFHGASTRLCPTCTSSPSHTYVRLMPQGTVTFEVQATTSVTFRAMGVDRSYAVAVDGVASGSFATSACGCWESDPVASSLSTAAHTIVLTNTTPAYVDPTAGPTGGLDIETWSMDVGGWAAQWQTRVDSTSSQIAYSSVSFVPDPGAESGTLALVAAGGTVTLFVDRTAWVAIEYVDNGAVIRVNQSDKLAGYQVSFGTTGTYRQVKAVDWGIPLGIVKVKVTVVSGTFALDRIWLAEAASLGVPVLVDPADAATLDVLTAYGDSITSGFATIGPNQASDGFADRLAVARAWRLADVAVGGTTATCYGASHTWTVLPSDPDRVLAAFGINDLIGVSGCTPTIEEFRAAMQSMLGSLLETLPGVPVAVGAILPAVGVPEEERATWDAAVQEAAAEHGMLSVDPSGLLDIGTEYFDTRHPNNAGATDIADQWAGVLPTSTADLSVTLTGPAGPVPTGQPYRYVVTVSNPGPSPADGVAVTDVLPTGVSLLRASARRGTCTGADPVVCVFGVLPPGRSVRVRLKVSASLAGSVVDAAMASSQIVDPLRGDNAASVTTIIGPSAGFSSPPPSEAGTQQGSPDVGLSLVSAPTAVPQGGLATLSVRVSNSMPYPTQRVTLLIVIPAGVTLESVTSRIATCSESRVVICQIGTLGAMGTEVVRLRVIRGTDEDVAVTARAFMPGDGNGLDDLASTGMGRA